RRPRHADELARMEIERHVLQVVRLRAPQPDRMHETTSTLPQLGAGRKLDYGLGMVVEGAELVRLAIASGKIGVASPTPLDPAKIPPPNNAPLPPSLETLLAWDASWLASLGWFSLDPFRWTPRTLGEIAGDDYDLPALSTCFLLPGGTD